MTDQSGLNKKINDELVTYLRFLADKVEKGEDVVIIGCSRTSELYDPFTKFEIRFQVSKDGLGSWSEAPIGG